MILSERIISLLFGYGAFTHEDVKKSAQILLMYAIGLCFVSLFNLLSRAYHASKEVKTPFFATLLVSAVNISLDVILGFTMGASGIALATSVSYIAGFVFLALRMKPSFDKKIFKISLASAVMGIVILLLKDSFKGNLGTIFLVLIGVFVYVLLSKLLKIEELEEILRRGSH
jgi:putative peptidoglycan lipid II flippase